MARRALLITYAATYLVAVGNVTRYLVFLHDDRFWAIALLLGGYLVLLFSGPLIIRRHRLLSYVYFLGQMAIVCTLSTVVPTEDFWAALFFPLTAQVMHRYPVRTGYLFTGIFVAITALFLLLGLDIETGLPLVLIFGVVNALMAAFIAIIREAETAREESQRHQAELESAHRQLQIYTTQAEELAVLQERQRLARELHDSVTQSLHSSALMAEAGQRLAAAGDLDRASHYLARLGEISQQALKEMRLLVYELRPLALRQVGLAGALQQRLDAVERRAGVDARLVIIGGDTADGQEVMLPPEVEDALYGIAQEALNNALKHASPSIVTVTLRIDDGMELEIADDGSGFDTAAVDARGGIGLTTMRERAEVVGATLTIHSAPVGGTRVCVSVQLSAASSQPPEINSES